MKGYRFEVIFDCGDRVVEVWCSAGMRREVLNTIITWPGVTAVKIELALG